MYVNSLSQYPLREIKQAFMEHTNDTHHGRFWPLIADLLRRLNAYDEAEQAWTELIHAIKSIGPHSTPSFNTRFTRDVIPRIGGWKNLCTLTYEKLDKLKIKFNESYIEQAKEKSIKSIGLEDSKPNILILEKEEN